MNPLAAWLARMRAGLARFVEANIVADDPTQGADRFDVFGDCPPGCQCEVFDQDDPCLNPGLHARQGCERCQRFIQASRDFLVCESLFGLPTADVDR